MRLVIWCLCGKSFRVNNRRATLGYVFNKHTCQTSDVTHFAESAIYILYIFANNFATKRDHCYTKHNHTVTLNLLPIPFKLQNRKHLRSDRAL